MDDEKRNKTLAKVLIVLGIILSIGGIIAMIAGLCGFPVIDNPSWLFGAIVGGFNIWIIGVLMGRKHRMNRKMLKNFFCYKIMVVVFLIGHLATSFGNIMLIKDPPLDLNRLLIYLLSGCLGLGIAYLFQTQKKQSTD
jgi:hypothetical protein